MYAQTADDIECPDAWLLCRKRYPNGLIWVFVFLPDGVKNTVATLAKRFSDDVWGRLKIWNNVLNDKNACVRTAHTLHLGFKVCAIRRWGVWRSHERGWRGCRLRLACLNNRIDSPKSAKGLLKTPNWFSDDLYTRDFQTTFGVVWKFETMVWTSKNACVRTAHTLHVCFKVCAAHGWWEYGLRLAPVS